MTDTTSQRRIVGFVLLALAVLVGVAALGTLMASCQGQVVEPSSPAPSASPAASTAPSGSAGSAESSPEGSAPGTSEPSQSPPATSAPSVSRLPTFVLPTQPLGGGDGPEPSIEIPPPIR